MGNAQGQVNEALVERLRHGVLYLTGLLAEHPEDVQVVPHVEDNSRVVLNIFCAETDKPHLIGKSGNRIDGIRDLFAAAGKRHGITCFVDIPPVERVFATSG